MDDPDARLEAAEPAEQPLPQVRSMGRPANLRAPYHQALEPELEEDLLLSIGQGLALIERSESDSPESILTAMIEYVNAVRVGSKKLPRDASHAAFVLACAYGQQICRALGWGWAHLRRTKAPGIVVISQDCCYATGPRSILNAALESGDAETLVEHYEFLKQTARLPPSEPGRYLRLR